MNKFTTIAALSAVATLLTFSGAGAADGRDTSLNAGANAAIESVRNPNAVQAPVVEGRNVTVVDDAIAANADRAINEAVRQVRR